MMCSIRPPDWLRAQDSRLKVSLVHEPEAVARSLKIQLRAELENPRVLHLGWLPPLGSECVVDLPRAAAVEDVIDIQVALHAQPRRHPELLGEAQVEPADAMVVKRAGHDERHRRRRRARRAPPARA